MSELFVDDGVGRSSSDDELVSSITSSVFTASSLLAFCYIYLYELTFLSLTDTYQREMYRAMSAMQRCLVPARFLPLSAGGHRSRASIWWHGVAIAWERRKARNGDYITAY